MRFAAISNVESFICSGFKKYKTAKEIGIPNKKLQTAEKITESSDSCSARLK